MERNRIVKLVFNPLPLQMLIIKYLLLPTYFVTQVAVLAAPIPSHFNPSAPSHNAELPPPMPPPVMTPNRTKRKKKCEACYKYKTRCDGNEPCGACTRVGEELTCVFLKMGDESIEDGNGVSLSLWRPLFSVVTRGMTLNFLTSRRRTKDPACLTKMHTLPRRQD